MDQLAALRLFVRVVERGGISAAARSLGLSTTSASRRLQDLEAAMHTRLLNRTTRSVSPTESGQILYRRLSPLIEALDGVVREAGEQTVEPSGVLRVVARRSFGILHVAPAIAGFHAAFPKVDVELSLTEVVEIGPTRGTDLAIRLGPPREKSLVGIRLASDRRVLCASPAYLARVPPPSCAGDIVRHACLCYRREDEAPVWAFGSGANRLEVAVAGPLRSNSGEVLLRAARDGLGLALLPEWMVADEIAAGALVACLPELRAHPVGYQAEIYGVYARSAFVPAKITAFLAHLRAQKRPP